MRIAICDDDMAVTGVMDGMLQKIEKEEKIEMEVDVFFGGAGLWEQIQQTGAYDLIYLDIEMKDMDGITVARKIREKDPYTILIFVSAYDSYFRQLFEVEPFRFLDKPLDEKIFREYFLLAYKRISSQNERFAFRFEKRIYQLPLREIVYFESNLRLIYIHGKDREYRFYGKLNQVQEQMEKMSRYFIRIQRSYLVNYYHILSMNGKEVELITGEKLPVSKEYKDRALSRYLELLGDA
ncbi:MAG TPA: response regulator transcription factor [Candidatus Pullilachnospira intestinigallinarum]|uniref:Stage 0 sporulation protein A homolog n=1 Tax=Candidatus Eisenbergiella merdipullorum TaxID=2838553 RepID=A0A9D2I8F7_9FIRM|nr:response regulator transcription factor [Candidatus Pullilachnospira intestinigallinarum]HJA94012.1 LytTR family DNA-binding domain-containing protein [Candidatus Eisenbergiella merdipullorum]